MSKAFSLLIDEVEVEVAIEGSWVSSLSSSKDEYSFDTNENESISLE